MFFHIGDVSYGMKSILASVWEIEQKKKDPLSKWNTIKEKQFLS